MQRRIFFPALLLLALLLVSCVPHHPDEAVRERVNLFFLALKNGDTLTAKTIYPGIEKLYNISGCEQFRITAVSNADSSGTILVNVNNSFFGRRGDTITRDVKLWLNCKSETWFISDSKNLCSWSGFFYRLGMRSGCIPNVSASDQEVSQGMAVTRLLYDSILVLARKTLNASMTVSDFRIRPSKLKGQDYQASGMVSCSIPGITKVCGKRFSLNIYFTDEKGNITMNSGRISMEGTKASFDMPVEQKEYKTVSFVFEPESQEDFPSQNTKAWQKFIDQMKLSGNECEQFHKAGSN